MKKENISYVLGLGVGIGLIVFGHFLTGIAVSFIGIFGYVLFSDAAEGGPEFEIHPTIRTDSKSSIYEDEFEEYKHYEFINKRGIYKNK